MRRQGGIFLGGKRIAECVEYEDVSEGEVGANGVAVRADETWWEGEGRETLGGKMEGEASNLRCARNTTERICRRDKRS